MIPLPHTVTRLRATTTTDSRGDTITSWATPSSRTLRAWVQWRDSTENNIGRSAVQSGWFVFLAPTADVAAGDRIVWQGRTFEVDGEPTKRDTPMGRIHHVEAHLNIVEG